MGCESNRPRLIKKEIYFQKIDSEQQNRENNYQNFKTPVKLEFILQNIKIGDIYKIHITVPNAVETFFTEEMKATSKIITFNTCYICDYFFERQQYLNISLIRNGKNKGYVRIPLGIIIGSPKSTYSTEIASSKENLTIKSKSFK